jgi:hypothetical protein
MALHATCVFNFFTIIYVYIYNLPCMVLTGERDLYNPGRVRVHQEAEAEGRLPQSGDGGRHAQPELHPNGKAIYSSDALIICRHAIRDICIHLHFIGLVTRVRFLQMQVTVETLGHGFLVNVSSDNKNCPGLLVSILEALDDLGLNVLEATASCADTFRLEAVGGEVIDIRSSLIK